MVTHSSIRGSTQGFPDSSVGTESACKAGDPSSIPELVSTGEGKKLPTPVFWPGELHGLYGVAKSWTGLSDFHFWRR